MDSNTLREWLEGKEIKPGNGQTMTLLTPAGEMGAELIALGQILLVTTLENGEQGKVERTTLANANTAYVLSMVFCPA